MKPVCGVLLLSLDLVYLAYVQISASLIPKIYRYPQAGALYKFLVSKCFILWCGCVPHDHVERAQR